MKNSTISKYVFILNQNKTCTILTLLKYFFYIFSLNNYFQNQHIPTESLDFNEKYIQMEKYPVTF